MQLLYKHMHNIFKHYQQGKKWSVTIQSAGIPDSKVAFPTCSNMKETNDSNNDNDNDYLHYKKHHVWWNLERNIFINRLRIT